MTTVEIDRDELMKVFLGEARDGLESMEKAALALEKAPQDRELVQSLFRDAHTLKGNALSLGFPAIATFAHRLEDRLDAVRGGADKVSPELITLLLQSVDRLRTMIEEVALPAEQPEAANSLRVEVGKLDRMLALSGEMAIARSRMRQLLAAHGDRDGCEELDRLSRELQEQILRVRAVPLGPTLEHHARTVRDAAASHGKQARLAIEGGEVEVDTAVVELLRDPLTHLVRNAVAHGIESPSRRLSLGKAAEGTITLRARHDNGAVVLEVRDDGAGFDRERIAQEARARGMQVDAGDEDLFNVVFESGFSTAERVTDLSGRGVGLDVVRHNLDRLRGSVAIESERGEGAAVILRLPLTLAIIDAFFVGAAGETYAIPLDAVIECVDLPGGAGESRGVIHYRGEALPWISLGEHFGLPAGAQSRRSLVVVQHGRGRAGLAVERLDGEGETVLKPLSGLVQGVRGIAGSALLGDGRVALILDVPALLASAVDAARVAA